MFLLRYPTVLRESKQNLSGYGLPHVKEIELTSFAILIYS